MRSNFLLECAVLLVVSSSLDGRARIGVDALSPTKAPTITFSRTADGLFSHFGTTVKTEFVTSQERHQASSSAVLQHPVPLQPSSSRESQRKEWVKQALEYYSGVMRGSAYQRTVLHPNGVTKEGVRPKEVYDEDYLHYALRNYFALQKIRKKEPQHAERIYRKIISEIMADDENEHGSEPGGCKQASLAVSTLLLALLLQRENQIEDARSVFDQFLQAVCPSPSVAPKCACCARVIQAYALFEMKQGNSIKSVDLIWRAIRMDKSLRRILQWQQFRRAMEMKRKEVVNRTNRRVSALRP